MDDAEAQLLAAWRRMSAQDREALLAFAEFFAGRTDSVAPVRGAPAMPQPEPRPADESVVMAIKRLTRTYPMLDRRKLMGPTSLLMSQHALQGRDAAAVIDELQIMFERHYAELSARDNDKT